MSEEVSFKVIVRGRREGKTTQLLHAMMANENHKMIVLDKSRKESTLAVLQNILEDKTFAEAQPVYDSIVKRIHTVDECRRGRFTTSSTVYIDEAQDVLRMLLGWPTLDTITITGARA